MTPDQVDRTLQKYRTYLKDLGYEPRRCNPEHNYIAPDHWGILPHILWMVEEVMRRDMAITHPEKAARWLGFVQGSMWAHGFYCLEELGEFDR